MIPVLNLVVNVEHVNEETPFQLANYHRNEYDTIVPPLLEQ